MLSKDEKRIIESLGLIKNIVDYIVSDKPNAPKKREAKAGKLEEEVLKNKQPRKDVGQPCNIEFLEQVLFELKSIGSENGKNNFSMSKVKEKGKETSQNYSFIIKYQENESEERLKVEVDDGKEKYSFEIKKDKVPEKRPYQVNIVYENNRAEEKLEIRYNLRDYPSEREQSLQDFTNRMDKTLHILPKSIMGGVLGYTYLGENFMARRDDLVGDMARMVDVHEAIHTPDEYETRVLTSWMLTRQRMKYKR